VRNLISLLVVLLAGISLVGQTLTSPALEFAASGNNHAHDEFIAGVMSLHNSAYTDAAEHFRAAQRIDPDFVMAYWGEAMTFNHPFWNQQDMAAARRVLLKLGSTRSVRNAKAATPRERAYLNALEILYGDGDRDSRDFAFADEMKKLANTYPQDYEAAAFYVLALLSTRRIGDPAWPEKQATAGAILKAILEKYPKHPGALHYLMHTYDDPEHAPLALDAARNYEKVAVGDFNFHAMHMPSHVYMQLGMWLDVARCNQTAFDASESWVKSQNLNIARQDYHSLEFLQYAQLQMGQYEKARKAMALMLESARQSGFTPMAEEATVMAARTAIETGEWDVLSTIPANNQIPELLFARGLAASHLANLELAKSNASLLDKLARTDTAARRLIHASTEDLLRKLLLARIAVTENRRDDAERLGSEAVNLEAKVNIPAELTGIVKPAPEFYGEILLDLKEPEKAEVQFAAALKQRPGRALALLGLARSRAALKHTNAAREIYAEIAAMWTNADSSLPALQEIHAFLSQ
jgi:tetratricopeptide (TPR) repeat protein